MISISISIVSIRIPVVRGGPSRLVIAVVPSILTSLLSFLPATLLVSFVSVTPLSSVVRRVMMIIIIIITIVSMAIVLVLIRTPASSIVATI